MRLTLNTILALSIFLLASLPDESSAQQRTPVMEYAAMMNSFNVDPQGRLRLEGNNEALTTIFLPKGAPVEAVLTQKGSDTPLHVQDFYINHRSPAFASIRTAGKYKEYVFQKPGDYLLTYRTGGTVMTQLPFSVYKKSNNDEFDPKTAWYSSGPWSDWAYAYARRKDAENATLEFRMWGQRVSFDGSSVTDKYTVELKKDGDVVAVSRTNHIGTQTWLKSHFEMELPASKGGRKFTVKQLGARDGSYHFVVKKNGDLHAVYELVIKNNKPVLHPRQASDYAPRTAYLSPRYAGLSAPGMDGDIVWMKKLADKQAQAIASGTAAAVAGPTDAQKKRWHWLPTSIDPNRPFTLTVSNVQTRTDTGFAVGEDLVVFGTGFPTGVKYLKAGEEQAREIPEGETFSSRVFRVCGKKIILTKRTSVFVFDTETEKLTPIPTTEISLYDGRASLIRSDGFLVATVNAATKVTDGNIIKIIDVSGDNPVVIPIKNADYTSRDVSSVSVDSKNGHVAVASREKKIITAAKIAPLANQSVFDVSEYRGVGSFDITLEDETVYYIDQDYKVRSLKLGSKSPKAITEQAIATSGNGFWVRKGRLAVTTKENKFGTRYPVAITDSDDAPQTVAGTGTKIAGTSASLGMGGSVAIANDKTLFLAGTAGNSIGVGERLQILTGDRWQPILGADGKPIWGCEVVTSTGFMALKVRNSDGKTVIGYATYGQSLDGAVGNRVSKQPKSNSASSTSTSKKRVPLKLADDNPYNTNDEQVALMLAETLKNEKEIGKAFVQSFGKQAGAKRTVEAIIASLKSSNMEHLIDPYKRRSIYVADKDRPKEAKSSSGGQDHDSVLAALQGQWKAIRFSAEGKDLPDAAIENLKLTFAADKYVMNMGSELQTGTYSIDTSGQPLAMTINIGSGKRKGQKRLGSFKLLKNDRLLMVFSTNENDHPKQFVPDTSGNSIMAVYEKE